MAALPARPPGRQSQQPTAQAKGWQQTVSWRYLPAANQIGPQESPPSRSRPVARTSLDWGIVSPIMTKSGRRERIFMRFGKPPCDKRPILQMAATTGRILQQSVSPGTRQRGGTLIGMEAVMIGADRVALVGWLWFGGWIGAGNLIGRLVEMPGTGMVLGFLLALVTVPTWPWVLPQRIDDWMCDPRA